MIHWMTRAVTRGCRSEAWSVLKNLEGVVVGDREMRATVRVAILSWSINVLSCPSGKTGMMKRYESGGGLARGNGILTLLNNICMIWRSKSWVSCTKPNRGT